MSLDSQPLLTGQEYQFLRACHAVVQCQQEMVPLLAQTLGVKPQEVFYYWMSRLRYQGPAPIRGTSWEYYFHGLECDLKNRQDGRFLRLDFGPGGRVDTFSAWGVLQFIMTSKAPWTTFPALQTYLAETPPPFTPFSGSHARAHELFDQLIALGLVERADVALCELVKRHKQHLPEGGRVIALPAEYNGIFPDTLVCGRWVLSAKGRRWAEDEDRRRDGPLF